MCREPGAPGAPATGSFSAATRRRLGGETSQSLIEPGALFVRREKRDLENFIVGANDAGECRVGSPGAMLHRLHELTKDRYLCERNPHRRIGQQQGHHANDHPTHDRSPALEGWTFMRLKLVRVTR